MTVTLELESKVESRVRSKAKSLGKSVEHFLADLIDENVQTDSFENHFQRTATDEEWAAALDSLAIYSDKIPESWDDSRESIYAERENAQV